MLEEAEAQRAKRLVDTLLQVEALDVERVRQRLVRRFARRAALSGVLSASPVALAGAAAAPLVSYELQRRRLLLCLLYLEDPQFFAREDRAARLEARLNRPSDEKRAQTVSVQALRWLGRVAWPLAERRLLGKVPVTSSRLSGLRAVAGKAAVVQACAAATQRYLRLRREAQGFEILR